MAEELAVIVGVGIVGFLFFDLWTTTREDNNLLSLVFFGLGMVSVNVITWMIYKLLTEVSDLTGLANVGLYLFQVVLWASFGVVLYVCGRILYQFVKIMFGLVAPMLGMRNPFEKEEDDIL